MDPNQIKNNLPLESGYAGVQQKLTDWPKEPSLLTLKSDFMVAKPSHDEQSTAIKRWMDIRDVKGHAEPKTAKNRSSVQPKLVRRQNEWRYSALSEPFLSAEKLFKVSPVTHEDREGAQQNALVLENQFRTKINRVTFVDEYVRTCVDEGTVAVRLGWARETRFKKVMNPVFAYYQVETQEEADALMQAQALKAENPRGFDEQVSPEMKEAVAYYEEKQIPVVAAVVDEEEGTEEEILVNKPTLDILDFQNLYIDPACNGDLSKARFAILSFETSKAELIKDGRYQNLDRVNWGSNSTATDENHASPSGVETQQVDDELRKRVVAYEYWGWHDIDGNNNLVPIVATWIGDTMIRMERNPFPDKEIPIVLVSYLPKKKSVQGEPDAELLEQNQAILGAVTRGMIDSMGRSANGQTGFAKGMLDVVNRRRYAAGEDYEFNPNMHPDMGIKNHVYPEIPRSALEMLQMQNQEAEALTGVKAFSGGLSGEAYGDVAAGIRGMIDASAKREMNILRRLAKGMAQIGRKIAMMNQAFLSENEVVRITNEEFVEVRREDLAGEYDFDVDISTAEIEEAQAQDLAFMLQTMGNNMPLPMTQLILADIARLKRKPELAHRIENFTPEPDPLEVKKQELEIQKLELEIKELQSKVNYNNARAKEALSDADYRDLEFVERETGTNHAREIDKQGAQAEANIRLEAAKATLNKDTETEDAA